MEHTESSVKIYFSREYTQFKSIIGNRLLNEKKINRIIKDIRNGLNMMKYCPIVVDEAMNVIDGQHRLYVCRKLKENVYYVIATKASLHDIASMNSNTERWKGSDFVHCYKAQGNINYEILDHFKEKYDLPITSALLLLSGRKNIEGGGGGQVKSAFESGLFRVIDEPLAKAVMEQVKQFEQFPGHKTRAFISAILQLHTAGHCDWQHLNKKYSANPDALQSCSTPKDYLLLLEKIYNSGLQKRKTIY